MNLSAQKLDELIGFRVSKEDYYLGRTKHHPRGLFEEVDKTESFEVNSPSREILSYSTVWCLLRSSFKVPHHFRLSPSTS
jgi:hypothetical protein